MDPSLLGNQNFTGFIQAGRLTFWAQFRGTLSMVLSKPKGKHTHFMLFRDATYPAGQQTVSKSFSTIGSMLSFVGTNSLQGNPVCSTSLGKLRVLPTSRVSSSDM